MSKEKENKDGGFVDRYISKRKKVRSRVGLREITEAWAETGDDALGSSMEGGGYFSDLSGSTSCDDSSRFLSMSGSLEDEVRAFEVDDSSSSSKSSRPPSRSGNRPMKRGGDVSSRGGFGHGL